MNLGGGQSGHLGASVGPVISVQTPSKLSIQTYGRGDWGPGMILEFCFFFLFFSTQIK